MESTSTLNSDPSPPSALPHTPNVSTAHNGHTWTDHRIGRWNWRVRNDWLFLLDAGCPDWADLIRDPRAAQVKTNDNREVWRVQLVSKLIYAKVGRPARHWARARKSLFGPDSVREARIADYAARHQIQSVCPVAVAHASIDGNSPISILITAGLPHAQPLNEFWSALDPAHRATRAIKNKVIDAVARLIAHAHQCGFEHFDLHAGNVLLDQQSPIPDQQTLSSAPRSLSRDPKGIALASQCRPLFVDLHNVRIGRTVRDATVVRNLAQFNQWFRVHALLSDRMRFFNRYLHWRDLLQNESPYGHRLDCDRRQLLRWLERAAATHARSLYAKRDRRVLRSGRYFTTLDLPEGWRGHVFLESKHHVPGSRASRLTFTAKDWKQWLSNPLDWVKPADRRRLIKDSASAIVCRSQLPHPDGPLEIICKRAMPRNIWKRTQSLFRPSRAMSTWKRANALLHRQIPTARPLAIVERSRGGLLLDSLLITEYVEHAHDLDTVLTVQMREMSPDRQRWLKQQISESLSVVLHNLHTRGFTHRDLKAPNVIVQWNPQANDPPRIVLVDLDGIRQSHRPSQHKWLQMIVRLNVSLDHCRRVTRTDRLRFLLLELNRPGNPVHNSNKQGSPARDWKTVWRQAAAQSDRKRRTRDRDQERKFKKYGRF